MGPLMARHALQASPRVAVAMPRMLQQISAQNICSSCAVYATEKDQSVSFNDPTEQEAQRFLELGTIALETGDLEKAIVCYLLTSRNTIVRV